MNAFSVKERFREPSDGITPPLGNPDPAMRRVRAVWSLIAGPMLLVHVGPFPNAFQPAAVACVGIVLEWEIQ